MSEQENYLLDAVDALTLPDRRKVIQDIVDGTSLAGTHTVTIELPPLLEQLDEAIRGTIGIGGSGSLQSERNVLDADALHRFVTISSTIRDWARMTRAKVTPNDIGKTLRAWYTAYTVAPTDEGKDRFYIRQMTSWAGQIAAKLDPPRVRELPDSCPSCGASTWWNPATGHEYGHPLIVQYKPTGPDMIQQAKALCRSCETSWGVRELAFALEEAEVIELAR